MALAPALRLWMGVGTSARVADQIEAHLLKNGAHFLTQTSSHVPVQGPMVSRATGTFFSSS